MLPELWGGSADLAESNNTTIKGVGLVRAGRRGHRRVEGPARTAGPCTSASASTPWARSCPGIALHGPTRPYGGTFLQFSDYMRGAVRLAAVMGAPAIYVWTHDSIGLGEDGPTHQPVEHLAALRAIPGLAIVRPADANETAFAWKAILEKQSVWNTGPVGLALTRQNVPVLAGTTAEGVAKGAYVLADAEGDLQVIIMSSGSEVQIALAARDTLQAEGIGTRVVSVPCLDWFEAQDAEYIESVLPEGGHRAGVGRGRRSPSRGGAGSAARAARSRSSTTAPRPTPRRCTGSSASPADATVAAAKESLAAAEHARTRSRTGTDRLSRAQPKASIV